MTSQICSQPAPIATQLSVIAETSRLSSRQSKHGSVVEVWQEVRCQISNGSFFCFGAGLRFFRKTKLYNHYLNNMYARRNELLTRELDRRNENFQEAF